MIVGELLSRRRLPFQQPTFNHTMHSGIYNFKLRQLEFQPIRALLFNNKNTPKIT